MRIDLHTHSTASDGTQSPAEVVDCAIEAGLDVLALTDHDTTSGWDEAADAATRHGIVLVRGIEISCQHEGISIHLLGYLQNPAAPGLLAELGRSRESREARAQRIVELLSAEMALRWEDVLEQIEPGATIGRPHIADAMVAKG
ncbi:MAG TPA: PHP domain-containing protein, partial [Dermatophilaceae bacterium]